MHRAARQRPPRRARPARGSANSRSTCWRSRSSPRWPHANGTRTSSSRSCAAPGLIARCRGKISMRSCAMLAEGFTTRRGRRGALIHHDARQSRAARPARRAAHRAHVRRHDPGQRRLSGAARAREPFHRHRERGFRGREHGRRHLPARQPVLSHHARRTRRGAGRGCARPGADDSVLARRGARPQRRAVGVGVALAGGDRRAAAQDPNRRARLALARR